jgi:hypothetical protein
LEKISITEKYLEKISITEKYLEKISITEKYLENTLTTTINDILFSFFYRELYSSYSWSKKYT